MTLNWSSPRVINTARGRRSLRTASPTPEFWSEWRSAKAELQAQGISCRKSDAGDWQVCRWSDPATEPATEPAPVHSEASLTPPPAEANSDSRAASRVLDFQAPPLDPSRVWSDEQQAIFAWFRSGSGNLLVQARAGTGKSTTIKAGFSQAPEAEMLYAVFAKKNQLEAQAAISDPRVDVKTLHAIGYRIIRSRWHNAKPEESIEDARALRVLGSNAADDLFGALKQLVGFAKNTFVSPSIQDLIDLALDRDVDVSEIPGWNVNRLAEAALKHLQLSLERDPEGRISFNDMVWLPVAAGWVSPLYDLVCVDETQDMNLPQLLMVIGLVRSGGRICVVGDDRQAIFGFRGAAQDGMKLMQEKLNAAVLGLTITYRCPKSSVALAQQLVPDYRAADNAAEGVVNNIGDGLLLDVLQVGDAVLSRANAPLLPLCLKLLRKGVTARIEGRDIGKTLAAIVRKLRAKSIPHFIGRVTSWADKQKSRCRSCKNFESKAAMIDDQAACLIAVAEGLSSVSEIEPRLMSLFHDSAGFQKPAVVLSSVHKAKGLEWDRTFLLAKTFRAQAGGEEANIYYVALTRAKKEMTLVHESGKSEDN